MNTRVGADGFGEGDDGVRLSILSGARCPERNGVEPKDSARSRRMRADNFGEMRRGAGVILSGAFGVQVSHTPFGILHAGKILRDDSFDLRDYLRRDLMLTFRLVA